MKPSIKEEPTFPCVAQESTHRPCRLACRPYRLLTEPFHDLSLSGYHVPTVKVKPKSTKNKPQETTIKIHKTIQSTANQSLLIFTRHTKRSHEILHTIFKITQYSRISIKIHKTIQSTVNQSLLIFIRRTKRSHETLHTIFKNLYKDLSDTKKVT